MPSAAQTPASPDMRRYLEGTAPVLVIAALTAATVWYVWGSLRQVGYWHDEASYLLQASSFARGRWAAPAPPLPEFFEQLYVLLTPTFASKYPPGHGLLLVPGVLIGLPGLMPVLLSALTGALVFVLGRRLGGPMVGLFGWLIWLGTKDNLHFRASYLSEVTTAALWVVGWWALLRWYEQRRPGWLALAAAAVAWQAITRPLTALAFAIPVIVATVVIIARRGKWRELLTPFAVGCAILALIPIWSQQTTGNWRVTPLMLYTNTYTPWDRPGFGADTSTAPPQRAPDIMSMDRSFMMEHQAHTVAGLPKALYQRVQTIGDNMWGQWRIVLLPFAVLGLVGVGAVELTGLAAALLLVLAYLTYAHPAVWSLYYLELQPALALLTARGVVRAGQWLREPWRIRAFGAAAAGIAVMLGIRAYYMQRTLDVWFWQQNSFQQLLRIVPDRRSIVFVRYAPHHNPHSSLVRNEPFLDDAPHWVVYDRGAENAKLLRLAPDRAPYEFDEATATIRKLTRPPAGT